MEEDILVSIHCLAYNHEPYIRQCLDGFVMQQTKFKFEVLVHDDASTDHTADIIREYEKKYPALIKPIYQVSNQYSRHVNVGTLNLSRARGKYIAWCEGDDYWTDPLKLQKQVDFLEEHPEYGLVYTNFSILYQYNGKIVSAPRPHRPSGNILRALLLYNFIPTPTVLIRTDIYQQCLVGLHQKTWRMGDYPLWLEFALRTNFKYINEKTVVYRYLNTSASHPSSFEKYILFHQSCMDIQCYYADKSFNKDLLPYIIEHYNAKMYQICIENGYDPDKYRKYFRNHKGVTTKGKFFNITAEYSVLECMLNFFLRNTFCKKVYSMLS